MTEAGNGTRGSVGLVVFGILFAFLGAMLTVVDSGSDYASIARAFSGIFIALGGFLFILGILIELFGIGTQVRAIRKAVENPPKPR